MVNPKRLVTLGTQDTERKQQQQETKGKTNHIHKTKKMSNKDPIKRWATRTP